ncbi:hypothetical protein PROFUN_08506 [Planoprotostelium fungivorum]|uniref:Zinc-ribbon 15 domain-containing protein n=1 Tax=Planoprotostelium fungivorum TaxID=1890364 RepID=A0A2P6NJC6_9EUKA|nr:hypothetical protein PROFUN_08506 [Planoprotostelium fungivorum]
MVRMQGFIACVTVIAKARRHTNGHYRTVKKTMMLVDTLDLDRQYCRSILKHMTFICIPIIAGSGHHDHKMYKVPNACERCGSGGLSTKRRDEWFTFFFIPIFRMHKGDECFTQCPKCRAKYAPVFPDNFANGKTI